MSENIPTPTYYGPVATQGSQSTAIDTPTEGTLADLVLQPCEQAPSIGEDGWPKYTEIWRGPYKSLKDIATFNNIGKSRDKFIENISVLFNNIVQRYTVPDPGTDFQWNVPNQWIVKSIEVREFEAGDHAELRISYDSVTTYSGSDWGSGKDEKDTWSLDWQSYSITPYAFCKNDPVEDPPAPNYNDQSQDTAWRKNIEDFFQSQSGDKSKYEYDSTKDRTYFLTLNPAERKVAKKVIDGKSAVYHYPVLKHHREWYKKFSSLSARVDFPDILGDEVDHIIASSSAQLSACPYKFPKEDGVDIWKWLKVGDTMTESKDKNTNTVTFTRDEVWWGAKAWDINFYGNEKFDHSKLDSCRWEMGKV